MNKVIKLSLYSAIAAYLIRLFVDIVMYIFMMNTSGEMYNDFYYLVVPQFAASILITGFYLLFFREEFFSWFFRIFTVALILINIALSVLICFDAKIGYVWYFAMVAINNFFNALFLKCNIIPERKDGSIEHYPIIFEGLQFVCMVISLYAFFCGFPYLNTGIWTYYDLIISFKINMVCETMLVVAYYLCTRNNAEIIRDNMFDFEVFE